MKRLRIAGMAIAFHATQPRQRHKGIRGEPVLVTLTGKAVEQNLSLVFMICGGRLSVKVRGAQVAVIFWNFVFQNEMVAEGIPGQIADGPMILVPIFASMGEHNVWLGPLL